MNDFEAWLDRKAKGPAPKKRLPAVSARRRREDPKYRKATREYLTEHPYCEVGPIIKAAGFAVNCRVVATHVHHTRGRGRYLCDKTTFLASCSGGCHPAWVHVTNVKEATALGLLK